MHQLFRHTLFALIATLFVQSVQAQLNPKYILRLSEAPTDYKVYQRDDSDRCNVMIKGKYTGTEQLWLVRKSRYRYSENYHKISTYPVSTDDEGNFQINTRIGAELREWTFSIYAGERFLTAIEHVVCGDVYAVLGQSNATSDLGGPNEDFTMNGDTFNAEYAHRYARALGQGLWGLEVNEDPMRWRSWGPAGAIFYDQYHSGGWPLKLQHDLINSTGIPVGIVNAALSGSSIEQNFQDAPPIPPLENNGRVVHSNPAGLNVFDYFMSKLDRAGARESLKYILWYQGESDAINSCDTAYYYQALDRLYADWTKALPQLERVFLFQLNTSCLNGLIEESYNIRKAQLRFSRQKDSVYLIPTSGVKTEFMVPSELNPGQGTNRPCHYNRYGMEFLANRILPPIKSLIYNDEGIQPQEVFPNEVLSASLDKENWRLELEFRFPIAIDPGSDPSVKAQLKDYFFDQDYDPIPIKELEINSNKLLLRLAGPQRLERLSIFPASDYINSQRSFLGPWLSTAQSKLGMPFISDIPLAQEGTSQPLIEKLWDGSSTELPIPNLGRDDRLLWGSFTEANVDELILLHHSNELSITHFNSGDWRLKKTFNLQKESSECHIGDFNGDGTDELLLVQDALQIVDLNNLTIKTLWALSQSEVSPYDDLIVGDFDGDGRDDALLLDPGKNQVYLYQWKAEQDQLSLQSTMLDLPDLGISWKFTQSVLAGDFDGDGKDELLVLGQQTGLFQLNRKAWKLEWSPSAVQNLEPWPYPFDPVGKTLMTMDIDDVTGDELIILEQGTLLRIHGFDPTNGSWDRWVSLNNKQVDLGQWPFENTSEAPLFRRSKDGYILLLDTEFDECYTSQLASAALYEFHSSPDQQVSSFKSSDVEHSFEIYPNPTPDILRVETSLNQPGPVSLNLYNQMGKRVLSRIETQSPQSFAVDLTHFNEGLYMLELIHETSREVHKLLLVPNRK